MNILNQIQLLIPARLKYLLKPYYRVIFPNKLHLMLNPTFRCNYHCSYCYTHTIFDYSKVYSREQEHAAQEWIDALAKLPSAAIYIAGGEPMLFPGIADLINALPPQHQVTGMVTNLSLPLDAYRKIKRKLHLNLSLHREHVGETEFIAKVKQIKEFMDVTVNLVATPENLHFLEKIAGEMEAADIGLHVDPYINPATGVYEYNAHQLQLLKRYLQADRGSYRHNDYHPKQCSAGRNYAVIAPNGDVLACYGGLNYLNVPQYRQIAAGHSVDHFLIGNLFAADFKLNSADLICALPCKEHCDLDLARIWEVEK